MDNTRNLRLDLRLWCDLNGKNTLKCVEFEVDFRKRIVWNGAEWGVGKRFWDCGVWCVVCVDDLWMIVWLIVLLMTVGLLMIVWLNWQNCCWMCVDGCCPSLGSVKSNLLINLALWSEGLSQSSQVRQNAVTARENWEAQVCKRVVNSDFHDAGWSVDGEGVPKKDARWLNYGVID